MAKRCSGCQQCVVRCPTGALTVDSRTRAAVADDSRCVACRQCERVCPSSAIAIVGSSRAGRRTPAGEAHLPGPVSWDHVIVESFRCLSCPDPTCVRGCPAHNDIPGFIAALARRDPVEAQEILSRTTVLPDICSRVCDRASQCEGACSWALAGDDPVAIGLLERFACDRAPVPPPTAPVSVVSGRADPLRAAGDESGEEHRQLDVVIVGSGPAAIGAAWELVQGGAQVTVLERDSEPGGQLRWGIPSFTLPRELVVRPWKALQEAGVVVWCNVEATPDRLPGLRSRFDAVVMAYGAWVPPRCPFEGDHLDGVWDDARFLRAGGEAQAGGTDLPAMLGRPRPGSRQPTVLVVGAGDTGLDVSRLAVRLGARAVCVERSDRQAAVARPEGVVAAECEGVEIRFRTALARAESTQGWVDSVVLVRTGRDGHPATRRRSGSGVRLAVDLVVVAQGSRPDPVWEGTLPGTAARQDQAGAPEADDPLPDWQACGLVAFDGARQRGITKAGAWVGEQSLRRERAAMRAAVPVRGRVWVVGDAFTGAATVVEAMVAGRRAAQEILRRGRNRML